MGENSAIAWTDHTFNPWIGCTKVSAGCAHCYAETLMDKRYGRARWGKGQERKRTSESNWREPIKWDRDAKAAGKRARVFCASLADVFDHEVPEEWRIELFSLIAKTPNLDWLILTKRPQNFELGNPFDRNLPPWPWPNVWLGVSVEDQKTADERIPILLETLAAIRFVSYEPALGPVGFKIDWFPCTLEDGEGEEKIPGLDWIIVGGESGHDARPFNLAWARSTIRSCHSAGVACFVKQMGAVAQVMDVEDIYSDRDSHYLRTVIFKDRKGADPAEWPEDLRVQEFPR